MERNRSMWLGPYDPECWIYTGVASYAWKTASHDRKERMTYTSEWFATSILTIFVLDPDQYTICRYAFKFRMTIIHAVLSEEASVSFMLISCYIERKIIWFQNFRHPVAYIIRQYGFWYFVVLRMRFHSMEGWRFGSVYGKNTPTSTYLL